MTPGDSAFGCRLMQAQEHVGHYEIDAHGYNAHALRAVSIHAPCHRMATLRQKPGSRCSAKSCLAINTSPGNLVPGPGLVICLDLPVFRGPWPGRIGLAVAGHQSLHSLAGPGDDAKASPGRPGFQLRARSRAARPTITLGGRNSGCALPPPCTSAVHCHPGHEVHQHSGLLTSPPS